MDNRTEAPGGTPGPPAGTGQDVVLRRERPADHAAVEQLQRLAFDDPDDLPSLVAALRRYSGRLPTVSIVAVAGDTVVGHTMLSASWLVPLVFLEDDGNAGVLRGVLGTRLRRPSRRPRLRGRHARPDSTTSAAGCRGGR